jgi:hypothetical protein
MYLDARVEEALAREFAGGGLCCLPAKARVSLTGLEHARFHWRGEWRGRIVGAFCGGCERQRAAKWRGAGRTGKLCRDGGGKSCRGQYLNRNLETEFRNRTLVAWRETSKT